MAYKHFIQNLNREPIYPDSAFREGQALLFAPGYHTSIPYWVIVEYYNPYARFGELKMTTRIPGMHYLDIYEGGTWDYHKRRVMDISYDLTKAGIRFKPSIWCRLGFHKWRAYAETSLYSNGIQLESCLIQRCVNCGKTNKTYAKGKVQMRVRY